MKAKTFDWLEKAQEAISKTTQNMTLEQQAAFWKEIKEEQDVEIQRLQEILKETNERKAS